MRRELAYAAVGALAATALAGGIAVAAIPGEGGTVQACYTKTTGALRVIDPEKGQTCHPSKELALSWGQAGPKGDPGSAGAPGAKGDKGDAGADGRSITWRGAFDCDALYSSGDVVSHGGSSWITDAAIGGCVNPPLTPWRLLAAKGADGPPGRHQRLRDRPQVLRRRRIPDRRRRGAVPGGQEGARRRSVRIELARRQDGADRIRVGLVCRLRQPVHRSGDGRRHRHLRQRRLTEGGEER
jgi:hypothetical protein